MRNYKKTILILVLVLIIVAGFEVYNLEAISFWHDEAFSALLTQYNFKEMLYRIGLDVHPPLYYLLLKIWAMPLGDSVFSLRLFSVFFGILTVLGVYLFTNEAFKNRGLALFCSVLVALSSFQIQHNMEVRMYTLGTFLVIISSYLLLRALRSKNWKWWTLYVLTASACLYTHYYLFFSVFAQGLYVVYYTFKESKFSINNWLENKNYQFGLSSYILVILFYLPWLGISLRQIKQVVENYWIPSTTIWSIPAIFYKMTTGTELYKMVYTATINLSGFWYILVVLMMLVVIAIIYVLKEIKTSAKWLLFLLLIVPFSGAIIFSLGIPIFLDRCFIFILPFYLIFIGTAILSIKNKLTRTSLVMFAIFGSLIAFPIHWINLEIENKPGMAGAANYLAQEIGPEDKIYVGSSMIYLTFQYYNQSHIEPLLFAPHSLRHYFGTALISSGDVIKDFNEEVKKGDTIWMINTTGFSNYQPILPDNWTKEKEKKFGDICYYCNEIMLTKYRAQ